MLDPFKLEKQLPEPNPKINRYGTIQSETIYKHSSTYRSIHKDCFPSKPIITHLQFHVILLKYKGTSLMSSDELTSTSNSPACLPTNLFTFPPFSVSNQDHPPSVLPI